MRSSSLLAVEQELRQVLSRCRLVQSQCRNYTTPTSTTVFVPLRLDPSVVTPTSVWTRGAGTSRKFLGWRRQPFSMLGGDDRTGLRYKSGDQELGETSTMHQEGGEIQEVPLAVLKTKGSDCEANEVGVSEQNSPAHKPYIDLDAREEAAFVEGFNNFTSPQQILKMLETIPTQEVTPFVSLGILRKLFELENNFVYRNDGLPWTKCSENSVMDGFARTAIVNRLVDTILTTDDTTILLSALAALKCERPMENSSGGDYRDRLFDAILLRVTTGQFHLNQVCEAIITLGKIERDTGKTHPNSLIDKLWTGVFEKSEDVDAENITLIFQALPYFTKSRRLVLNLAEKKLLSNWWKMNTEAVSKICQILITEKSLTKSNTMKGAQTSNSMNDPVGVSSRVLSALARCTSLNMHKVTEVELYTIVRAFLTQNFCDATFEKALNKYMKAKCLKISDPNVVATILEYTKKFHMRSETILEAAAEFIVVHKAANLSPPALTSIVTAFGHLDFQPANGVRFWQIVEAYLDEKFIQFTPKDIIEVLLSCVQLMKFPLNFADRMFSPYFLDRVHTEQDYSHLQSVRSKLKLLDIAMTIECPYQYRGPMLPKDFTSRSVFIDGRILRMGNWLEDVVKEVLGVRFSVEKFVVLPGLPLNTSYISDILIANVRRFESERYNYLKNRIASRLNTGVLPMDNDRELTVILIHVPEHYSRDGEHLIGSEVMRIRHFKSLGFNVASLAYTKISELKVNPSGLRQYLREKVQQAGFSSS